MSVCQRRREVLPSTLTPLYLHVRSNYQPGQGHLGWRGEPDLGRAATRETGRREYVGEEAEAGGDWETEG